jgi:glycosyltransferase involved in cell wall biosynthesis
MRILMDGRPMLRPWMGGVPRLASSLATSIRSSLDDDELIIAATGFDPTTTNVNEHKKIPNKLVAFLTYSGLSSFDRLFRDKNADVLFFPNIEFIGRSRTPYALLIHDLSFIIEPRWFDWKTRLWHVLVKPKALIKNATHLFAVSQNTKNDIIRLFHVDEHRITIVPMGLNPIPPLPAQKHDKRFILCLGGSNPRKNASCVVAAHAALIKDSKYADVELMITGSSFPLIPLLRRGGARGGEAVEEGVTHLDRPSDTELFALMRDATIFCYPSWYEGFGMPLHEAARFGTPCIASTASSLPEIAPEGTLFASPTKPHHWVEAMCQVLDNPEKHRTKTVLGGWDEAGRTIAEKLREIAKA